MIRFVERKSNKETQQTDIHALCKTYSLSPITAKLLVTRGIDDPERFLSPDFNNLHDPYLLPDMDKAVSRIRLALSRKERIAVYGDYDVDGLTAAAILCRYLDSLKADYVCHIPHRHEEGYGLNEKALRCLKSKGVSLVVTVDCGISGIGEAEIAKEIGVDLIVTDHHQCSEVLPDCYAVVVHTRPDAAYPYPYLCGAGIAAKLVSALGGTEALKEYIDLLALGTVADMVPLLGENRIFAYEGLKKINSDPNTGIRALLCVSHARMPVSSEQLVFLLAPRINAAGRMASPELALRLLMTDDNEEAMRLAGDLESLNSLRQQQEQSMFMKAEEIIKRDRLLNNMAIVIYDESFASGIAGIVASRLVQRYTRPAAVLCREGEKIVGSLRSVEGIDVFCALKQCAPYLEKFGGHEIAGGITLLPENLDAFRTLFCSMVESSAPEAFLPHIPYDGIVTPKEICLDLAYDLKKLEPYGQGNPEPVFLIDNVALRSLRKVGKDGKHLQLKLGEKNDEVGAIAFGRGNEPIEPALPYRVLATVDINEFRDTVNAQCIVGELNPIIGDAAASVQKTEKFVDCFYRHFLYNKIITFKEQEKNFALQPGWLSAVARWFKSAVQGSLVLCYTPEGAGFLLSYLQRENALDFFRLRTGEADFTVPYNTVLLAPQEYELEGYTNVLCVDPLCRSQIPDGALIAADENAEKRSLSFLHSAILTRQELLKAYADLQKLQQMQNAATADGLALKLGVTQTWLETAAKVFSELALVSGNLPDLQFVRQEKRQELLNSKTFARLQKAEETYKVFYQAIMAAEEVS